ncbi:ABC transporter ATP-binding protein/permease [Selenomonas sp. TAMA-11512]|uniref:ABC transporter ATP-binding protein/permease n=1 Tax=Selenomonas sp. TAMA-11512 TaxID=3095337 RepID=UPI0030855C81|nr:ABC transporter ATP-binding protein/permease [Selenomonas sp. TAMA-11512]
MEHIPVENRSIRRDFWRLFKGYWQSEEKWKGRGLFVVVVALNFLAVYLLVLINDWYNEFYNALQAYEYSLFWPLVGKFALLAFIYIGIAVYAIYLRQMLQIRWRTWLTKNFLDRWLKGRAYYRLQLSGDGITDNPDQRISEDVAQFVELSLTLIVGFLKQLTTLAAFAVVLWNLSGVLTVPLGSHEFQIYGYMLWFSLLYSVLGTWGAHQVGKKLIGLNFEQQRCEADFRFSMMRVREHSESVAFYGGEAAENVNFKERFFRVIKNFRDLMQQTKLLNFYTNGYGQLAVIVPLILAAPRYFSHEMALGGLMQTISAFGRVQDALSYFVDAYASIARFASVIRRLGGFLGDIEQVEAEKSAIAVRDSSENCVEARTLSLDLPNGRELLRDCSFSLSRGESLLVTGASGTGKSTLLRAVSGLWIWGDGELALPEGERVLFLPQRPYLPLGTLRHAISYPMEDMQDDAKLREVLSLVGMEALAEKLDVEDDWSRILSLGEQQRLAFARVLLVRPQWAFLDEATSALDESREGELYRLLKREFPQMGLVSVGHRSTLYALHNRELALDGQGGYNIKDL